MTQDLEEMEYLFLKKIMMLCVDLEEIFFESSFGKIFDEITALGTERFLELVEKYDYKCAELEKKHGIV